MTNEQQEQIESLLKPLSRQTLLFVLVDVMDALPDESRREFIAGLERYAGIAKRAVRSMVEN